MNLVTGTVGQAPSTQPLLAPATPVGGLQLEAGTTRIIDLEQPLTRAAVGAPQVADVTVLSPVQVLVSGRKPGRTQLVLWDKTGRQQVYDIVVTAGGEAAALSTGQQIRESDLVQLRGAIARAAPGADIRVELVGNSLVLSGQMGDVDSIARVTDLARVLSPNVVNHLGLAGEQQVVLRCTVAEVSRTAIKNLGVDAWINVQGHFADIPANAILGLPNGNLPVGNSAMVGRDFIMNTNVQTGTTGFTIAGAGLQMQLFLHALQENRLLRVLAEPNLVGLNGQPAEFLAGGEFPVPVPQSSAGGGVTITIEWKKFGVHLRFTPTIIGRQMIRLTVGPQVSELDYTNAVQIQGFLVPALSTRSALTTIEVPSGGTIALGGLLSERVRAQAAKVAGLGEIPVLGALFRSVEYQTDKTELLILVTPELVSAMHPDQIPPVPGESLEHPSDWQFYGLGMIEGCDAGEEDRAEALQTEQSPQYRKHYTPPAQMSLHGPFGPADDAESVQ